MHYYISFVRRPHCGKVHLGKTKIHALVRVIFLYVSVGRFQKESDHEKTNFCRRRQKRNQTAVQKVRNSEYLNGHKLGVYHIETNFRGRENP